MVSRRAQLGISLIITMIMLGALMMSGIAMFRKLSAGSVIAGNLTFTNSAIAGADNGAEAARSWLLAQSGAALFNGAPGYFAAHCYDEQTNEASARNCNATGTPSAFDPLTFDWDGNNQSVLVTADDGAGNQVRTVTHRLCDIAGSLDDPGQNCVLALQTNAGSGGHGTVSYGTQQLTTTMKPYYRITTRVRGPRNAVAYTQITMF